MPLRTTYNVTAMLVVHELNIDKHVRIINGVIESLSIDGLSYVAERFNDRYRQEEAFRLW